MRCCVRTCQHVAVPSPPYIPSLFCARSHVSLSFSLPSRLHAPHPLFTYIHHTNTPQDLIKVNIDKNDKVDAFVSECRESEGREAFKEMLATEAAAAAAAASAATAAAEEGPLPVAANKDAPSADGDEDAGGAEPEGVAGEEGENANPVPWPPVKEEGVEWKEYLEEYRGKCLASGIIVKRDPASKGVACTSVQLPAYWATTQVACLCVCVCVCVCACVCLCYTGGQSCCLYLCAAACALG